MADPTGVEAAASYGVSEALLATHPELRAVYELFKAGNTGAALEGLYKTNYYKTMSSTVKAREKQKLEQPQVYADSVEKYRMAARKRLVTTGIKIDTATFDSLVSNAYAKGMSDDQLDQAIATSGKITGFGGNILGDTTTLKTYAASFGVNNLLNDAYWTSKQNALFQGTVTTDDIQKEIRDLSASAFPAYADGIANGLSIASQASNVITSYATFLELDPETVDFNNPTVRKIAQYIDPLTGKPARMPQWMVEKTIKSDPAWGFTKNGQKAVDDLTLKVSNDWFGGAR
jgi:hypothetical protein